LKVSIKSLEVDMEIKNKGVELEVFEANGTTRLGDLVITKTDLIWCSGRTRRENGIKMKWPAFIQMIQESEKTQKKTAGKKTASKKAALPASLA
jgi:hypothetical protein